MVELFRGVRGLGGRVGEKEVSMSSFPAAAQ